MAVLMVHLLVQAGPSVVNRPTRPSEPLGVGLSSSLRVLDRSCLAVGPALLDFHNRFGWSIKILGRENEIYK